MTDPYKVNLDFKKHSWFSGYLKNPIEIVSGLPQLANWIMDVVLDNQYLNVKLGDIQETVKKIEIQSGVLSLKELPGLIDAIIQINIQQKSEVQRSISSILTKTLVSKKYGNLRFGIGQRGLGGARVQIVGAESGKQIYPSIFNLSSGEAAMLCLFGELLRQADNLRNNIPSSEIHGVVLVDEIDKHLHIKLQKEVLPELFNLFPNVQFIVSSHSPFLSMGLAEKSQERAKIIDLDNLGVSNNPIINELYTEVYNMMVGENERFKEMYEALAEKIKQGEIPLIVTEGKTDVQHIKKAKEKLGITDLDVDYFEIPEKGWGSATLKTLLENLCKVYNTRKVIGVFDRDEENILADVERDNQPFKSYGNNVFSFCIPIPTGREKYKKISIEFYYSDLELKKEKDGKRLYFDNELNFDSKRTPISPIAEPKDNSDKKMWCDNIGDLTWIHSKTRFAELVENDPEFSYDFNFENFRLIFDKIKCVFNNDAPVEAAGAG